MAKSINLSIPAHTWVKACTAQVFSKTADERLRSKNRRLEESGHSEQLRRGCRPQIRHCNTNPKKRASAQCVSACAGLHNRLEGGQPVGPIIAKTISNSITSVMQVDIRLALPPSSLVSNFHPSLQESMRVARPASLNLGSRKAITTNLGKRESTSLEAAVIPVGGRVEKLG